MRKYLISFLGALALLGIASPAIGAVYGKSGGAGGGGTVTTDGVTIGGTGTGGNPIAGLPSSASNAGTMSAANFTRLANGFDPQGWYATQKALIGANTSFTNFREVPQMGFPAPGTSLNNAMAATGLLTGDGQTVGGSTTIGTGPSSMALSTTVWTTPKTTGFALAFLAKFSTGSNNSVGYSNVTNSHSIDLGCNTGISTTNYSLGLSGSSTTPIDSGVAIDSGYHTFVITFDTTTVKLFIDGTQRGSTATISNLIDENVALYAFNGVAGTVKVQRLMFAY